MLRSIGSKKLGVAGTLLLALAAIAAAFATQTQARRPAKPVPSVISPRGGQRVAARPVSIRVQLGRAALVGARFNGRPILSAFQLAGGQGLPCTQVLGASSTVCRVTASPDDGLRFGPNALAVKFRQGRKLISRTVRFSVAGNRPLAAAGRDRSITPDRRIRLNGRGSLMAPGLRQRLRRAGRKVTLRYRWRVLRYPRRGPRPSSGDDRPGRPDPYGNVPAELAGANTATPSIEADIAGTYVLRLTVTSPDGRSGSDDITLSTGLDLGGLRVAPAPLTTIDTMAVEGGQHGVKLGGAPLIPADDGSWLQVVVLDRQTLALITNKSYPCPGASYGHFGDCPTQVANDLSGLKDNVLVIAVAQPFSSGPAPYGAASSQALEKIGITHDDFPAEYSNGDKLARGTLSAIGVPDGDRSTAVVHSAETNALGGGRINGYLIRDNNGDYTFAGSDRPQIDTQAPGSNTSQNVVSVGGQAYPASFSTTGKSTGGFQVVVLDRRTLQVDESQMIETGTTSDPSGVEALDRILRRAVQPSYAGRSKDSLVIVASRGTAAPTYGPGDDPQYRFPLAIADIANQIEKLGGTRGGTMTALDASTNGYSYTLVGGSGYAAGTGSETRGSGTQAAWALSSTPQTDILARGNDYGFQVVDTQVGNRTPDAGSHFNQVFFQAPSAWPEKTAQQAAWIKWIGAQGTVGLGDDPRAQYWTQPYTKEYWDGKLSAVGALTYPASDPGFCSDPTSCKDDFNWAKQELTTEIGWLEAEHGYVQTLAQPFADNVLQSWSDLQTIENDVNSKVQADPNEDARLKSKLVGDFARNIGEILVESVPGLGKAVHVANLVYETAMEYTNVTAEGKQRSAEEEFQAKVRELGGKLADRLQAAKASLTRRGADVIAADYAKLRTVGLCASGNSSCPDDIGEWQFTGDDQTNAARGLRAGLQASFYAALLPLKYTGWTLPTFTRQTPGQYFFSSPALRNPGDTMCPFDGEPASAQVAIPVARLFYPFAAQAWQVRALGYLTGDGTFFNGWQMHFPDATVTDRVFGSVDPGGDLKKGGLGLDPEAFFDVNFPSKTLDNYPYRDTATSWHDHIYNSNNHNCG